VADQIETKAGLSRAAIAETHDTAFTLSRSGVHSAAQEDRRIAKLIETIHRIKDSG